MSGTTTIALPSTANPATVTWGLERNDGSFVSPLNGYTQELERAGARWMATLTWNVLSDTDAAQVAAWAARMSKAGIRCRIQNYGYVQHGAGGGTPIVNGANQTGIALITKGWPNTTTVLKAGDMVQLATGQLIMICTDATSDGAGNATLDFEPKIRTSPADLSALTLANPTGLFMFPDKKMSVAYTPANPHPKGAFSVNLVEDPQ